MSQNALPKVLFTVAMMLIATGCAETRKKGLEDMRLTPELVDKVQKEGRVSLNGRDGVICRLEMPTGSHLGVWRCDTVEGANARAEASQREIQRAQAAPKPKIGT